MPADHIALAMALLAGAVGVLPSPPFAPPSPRSRHRFEPRRRRMLLAGIGGLAAGALLSVPAWAVAALAAGAVLAARVLPDRLPVLDVPGMRDVAGILDLLATCLEAGLPVGRSISAVLHALDDAGVADGAGEDAPGAAGTDARAGTPASAARRGTPSAAGQVRVVLGEVAALLALGADPESAWRPAATHPELAVLAAAARRSAVGGVRLAEAVRESAAQLRARCRAAGERSAARAGVAMTAPLALCFLPAFVCLGLAPVVIGLVSTLHIW